MIRNTVILLLVVLFVLGGNAFFSREKLPSKENYQTIQTTSLTGKIRTAGLQNEEIAKLELVSGKFQLVLPNQEQSDIQGYFLEPDKPTEFSSFEGKCVKLTGSIPKKWQEVTDTQSEINNQYTYGRSVIAVDTIDLLPFTGCDSLTQLPKQPDNTDQVPLEKFYGMLQRTRRPAPNISHDYKLVLDTTKTKLTNQSSGQSELLSGIDLYGPEEIIETLLGKSVFIEGRLQWDYAESQVIVAETIQEL